MAKGSKPVVYEEPDKDYRDSVRFANLPVSRKVWLTAAPSEAIEGREEPRAGEAPAKN